MKLIRTEKQKTPIGQEVKVEWYLASVEEAEKKLRGEYGEIAIVKDGKMFKADLENGENDGPVRVWNETADEERHKTVNHLSEAFSGEVEFCGVADV